MSQAQPFQPNLHPDEEGGIPAADPGAGAPPTAPGFGVEGEDADEVESTDPEEGTDRPDAQSSLERSGEPPVDETFDDHRERGE